MSVREIHDEIAVLLEQEATFALGYAEGLDKISHLRKPYDQRFSVLDVLKGRLDGLRIALDVVSRHLDRAEHETRG